MQAHEESPDSGVIDEKDSPTHHSEKEGETTEVKPLTRRKKKVKLVPEPSTDKLNDSLGMTGSLTQPWCGKLEPVEEPGPYPGPFNTSLFWIRHGRHNLAPMPGRVNDSPTVDPKSVRPAVVSGVYAHNGVSHTTPEVFSSSSIAPWKQGKVADQIINSPKLVMLRNWGSSNENALT